MPNRSASMVTVNLLGETLGLECLDNVRACADPCNKALQLRPLADVDPRMRPPTQHHEQVGIGDGELLAHEKAARAPAAVEPAGARSYVLARVGLGIFGRV